MIYMAVEVAIIHRILMNSIQERNKDCKIQLIIYH